MKDSLADHDEPIDGIKRDALVSALIRLRPQIIEWRDRAIISAVLDPINWQINMGVPIGAYLDKLDRLDAICAKAEAERAGQ